MEELQYYFREKDETNQQLKYQVKHLSEKIRTSKKVCDWFVNLWCLTPLSTIFELYRGGVSFIGGGNQST